MSATTPATGRRVIGNKDKSFWLFDPENGYDLTHPQTLQGPSVSPRLTLDTVTMPVTIAPLKTALIIIDMQNLFLSPAAGRSKGSGPGHDAEEKLLSSAIPACRAAGIQIVHITWGLSEEELSVLPPTIFRSFSTVLDKPDAPRFDLADVEQDGITEGKGPYSIGEDMGEGKLPDGSTVPLGRLLMRDQWNMALHGPLEQDFQDSLKMPLPDVRFYKHRISGFAGGDRPVTHYLRQRGITTLLFTGVNTDQCVFGSLQDAVNQGFDAILLKDGCGTASPDYSREMVEFNCRKGWGFVATCDALSKGAKAME